MASGGRPRSKVAKRSTGTNGSKGGGRYTAPVVRSPTHDAIGLSAAAGPVAPPPSKPEGGAAVSTRARAASGGPGAGALADGLAAPVTGLDAYLERVAPETVAVTYWVDPPAETAPADQLVLCLAGRRTRSLQEAPGPDRFEHEETVESLVGGSGPVAVTTRVTGVAAGEWEVNAHAVLKTAGPGTGRSRPLDCHRAEWSWLRWAAKPSAPSPVATRLLPLALAPATLLGVWAVLAGAGIALAILTQGWVASARGLVIPHLLSVSLASVAAGVVGAKAWYMVAHRDERRRDGWCIQGLVSGVAIVGVALAAALGVRIGTFVDVTAPGLLFGMALGRVGCFFAGCCYGRPTSSRWGIWSSDRRVGARRIPTQLLESLLAASVGAGALTGSLSEPVLRGGVLVAALGAYTLVRQRLLRWRAEPRQSSWLTTVASAAAAVMAAAGIVVAAV